MSAARHLYVHVPFCRRRCTYCDFSIAVLRVVPVGRYLAALAAETERVGRPEDLATVYLGGGTPSLLGATGVPALAAIVGARPGLEEFTLEANPDDVSGAAARAWVRCGVNRLSLGAQSFDDGVLRWMHRTHDAAAIGAAVAAARSAGIANLSLDLIFGLPESLGRGIEADLDRVLALEPEHVSLYGLTVEDHTPLGRAGARGASTSATEERYEAEYLRIHERLAAAGYGFYEVSNAARPGFAAVHNRAYWRLAPYLGLGPSAHSFDGAARWWNEPAYARWEARLARGDAPVVGREILAPEQRRLESLYLGLRTSEGIALEEPLAPALAGTVTGWVAAGWAEVAPGAPAAPANGAAVAPNRLRLTPRGWLRLDELVLSL